MKASQLHYRKGHSTGYSKKLTLLKSIGRVTLEVKVKSTIKLQLYTHFKKYALLNDIMWKQADLLTSKDTLQAI